MLLTPLLGAGILLAGSGCSGQGDSATVGGSSVPRVTSSAPSTAPTTAAATSPAPGGSPASSASSASSVQPTDAPTPPAQAELPRGGRTLFPTYRLVGYAGRTGSTALGRLGIGDADERVSELERRAEPYAADGRKVLPVLEVIATTVQASPGRDGRYRARMSDRDVQRYLDVARRHHALLLLAIQPGRADFLPEVEAYDKWLAQPDVGVALDPEWAIGPGQVPGRVFGHTTGAELDDVAAHLSALSEEHDLPEKVMVFHELAARIVTQESGLRAHPGVVEVKSVDGIGSRAQKEGTYRVVNADSPKQVRPGFKLFYVEDRQTSRSLMTPTQVMALKPRPDYVMYE